MGQFLADLVMTSLTVLVPGLYFVLLVEPVEGLRAYRYRFIHKESALEALNNAITVGLIGYILFLFSVPALEIFLDTAFGFTFSGVISSSGEFIQAFTLFVLTLVNVSLAYTGLRK